MHPEILEGPQKSALAYLDRAPLPPDSYLAGGTALALHLGHRRSVDLDFFTQEPFENEGLFAVLRRIGSVRVEQNEPGTFRGKFAGVQVSFIRYDYPLLDALTKPDFAPRIAGIRDIASMKLSAIMSQGSRRDFIDLYAVCQQGHRMEDVYGWFQRKYAGVSYDPYHLAKSLVYFVDAEKEPVSVMLQPLRWDEVRDFFIRESARVFSA
jgi:hypothetical protein